MTIQATRQVLFDGPRRAVMLFTGVCDGNGGDEVNEKKVVVADLTPPCHHANIEKVEYEVSGGIVRILWGAPDPVTFLDLAQQGEIDYKEIGGAINPTSADTPNDIWFTTIGFDMGSSYSIKITMRKKGVPFPASYTAPVPA
jgi:hypothetical protein